MKDLLFSITKKDFEIQVFRAGGKGGQKQNKTSSGVRIIHHESGARGESREERSQKQNKTNAFNRCINNAIFQGWLKRKTSEIMYGANQLEQKLQDSMELEHLTIEVKQGGKWVELSELL